MSELVRNPAESAAGVRLKSVSKLYHDTVAVKDFSLEVQPGEFVFLLGPSGAGKSTVLRLIGGYERVSSGQILIGDKDVTRLPVYRRDIGMVFQNYALFPHMTVAQNVGFGLKMRRTGHSEALERVREALQLVELDGLDARYPRQLSGGQQQRVALARAIVYRPALLLLDEPLANLDRRLRDSMRIELKQLQQRIGITTIMVTHDQEESLTMADRIVLMQRGHLEQVGTPAEIYNRPASTFVAGFIGEMNVLHGEVVGQEGQFCRLACHDLQFQVRHDSPVSAGDPVTICLRAERLTLARPGQSVQTDLHLQPTNTVRSTIEFITYLGAATLYLVRPDGSNLLLKVLETNREGESSYRQGDTINLSWPVDSNICFFNGNR